MICKWCCKSKGKRNKGEGEEEGEGEEGGGEQDYEEGEEQKQGGARVKCSKLIFFFFLLPLVVVLYFWGDNVHHIVLSYGELIHCDNNCQEILLVSAKVSQGMSLIMIHTAPLFHDNEFARNEIMRGRKWAYSALTILTVQVKIDMIYSIVTTIVQPEVHCTKTDRTLSLTFFVFSTILGWFSLALLSKFNSYGFSIRTVMASVFMSLSLPMFLLSDNKQPLDCLTGCGFPIGNSSSVDGTCKISLNYGLRLGFMVVVFALCCSIFILPILYSNFCSTRKSATLPEQ